jgi:hypothetical protein
MEQFESTRVLMELLGNGQYKRLITENEEETLTTDEDFASLVEDYRVFSSRSDNYGYFERRETKMTEEGDE